MLAMLQSQLKSFQDKYLEEHRKNFLLKVFNKRCTALSRGKTHVDMQSVQNQFMSVSQCFIIFIIVFFFKHFFKFTVKKKGQMYYPLYHFLWCGRSLDSSHLVVPLSFFSFQPVSHNWYYRGCGMYYSVYGMVHIKRKEGRKEMFYLTMHSTHFIYGYMTSAHSG